MGLKVGFIIFVIHVSVNWVSWIKLLVLVELINMMNGIVLEFKGKIWFDKKINLVIVFDFF